MPYGFPKFQRNRKLFKTLHPRTGGPVCIFSGHRFDGIMSPLTNGSRNLKAGHIKPFRWRILTGKRHFRMNIDPQMPRRTRLERHFDQRSLRTDRRLTRNRLGSRRNSAPLLNIRDRVVCRILGNQFRILRKTDSKRTYVRILAKDFQTCIICDRVFTDHCKDQSLCFQNVRSLHFLHR